MITDSNTWSATREGVIIDPLITDPDTITLAWHIVKATNWVYVAGLGYKLSQSDVGEVRHEQQVSNV